MKKFVLLLSSSLVITTSQLALAAAVGKCSSSNLKQALVKFDLTKNLEVNFTNNPTAGRSDVLIKELPQAQQDSQKTELKKLGLLVLSKSVIAETENQPAYNLVLVEKSKSCEFAVLLIGDGGMRGYSVVYADQNQIISLGDDQLKKPIIFTRLDN